jgi:hypothetical protein
MSDLQNILKHLPVNPENIIVGGKRWMSHAHTGEWNWLISEHAHLGSYVLNLDLRINFKELLLVLVIDLLHREWFLLVSEHSSTHVLIRYAAMVARFNSDAVVAMHNQRSVFVHCLDHIPNEFIGLYDCFLHFFAESIRCGVAHAINATIVDDHQLEIFPVDQSF